MRLARLPTILRSVFFVLSLSVLVEASCRENEDQALKAGPVSLSDRLRIEAHGLKIPLESPGDAVERYAALFEGFDPVTMNALGFSTDRSVAMQASWEEVRMAIVGQRINWRSILSRTRAFSEHIKRMTGFAPPPWWLRCLFARLTAEGDRHHEAAFSQAFEDHAKSELDGNLLKIIHQGREYVFDLGSEHPDFDDEIGRGLMVTAFRGEGEHYYVAPFDLDGLPSVLRCFGSNKKLIWSAEIWGAGHTPSPSFLPELFGYIAIATMQDSVAVFFSDGNTEGFEIFGASDGRPRVRFATSYWGMKDRVRKSGP